MTEPVLLAFSVALLILLGWREVVWRRRMRGVIAGVRALREELRRSMGTSETMRPWDTGQLSSDSTTSVRRPDPPPPTSL